MSKNYNLQFSHEFLDGFNRLELPNQIATLKMLTVMAEERAMGETPDDCQHLKIGEIETLQ